MFLGTHYPRLDDKGRLILPAKYRGALAQGLVVTRGQERCLYVFPEEAFTSYANQVISAPMTSKTARDFRRMLLSGAHDEVPDKQGRITIPAHLREYAGLDRDVAVIGNGDNLEIWDSQAWDGYRAESEPVYANQSEEVVPGRL
ncbi:MAG: division/cell wall cluster transcriptional repressor MraZ [Austwickia sp.]|jgi:MraZ protein|nr:division/cell wall cluster transcriptional repressor MraZ [Austwickia sp.]MBK8435744.1 division/cell wall cluster transcriptional repressor MraZ [Austwickia sp.]MBK9100695.1 division/cell wall cluster transcriptional repressor MraZ [Austwickia sp.]